MKKIVIFTIVVFISQLFCGSVFGQATNSEFRIVNGSTNIGYLKPNIGSLKRSTLGELEVYLFDNHSVNFNFAGINALQMQIGINDDFVMYMPLTDEGAKWNRIIAENQISFSTGGRGKSINESDLFITTAGNVGIGTYLPSEKLTVTNGGNIKLENGKLLISNKGELRINNSNELEAYGDSLMFNVKGLQGLQMKKGANGDFTLYFPNSDTQGTKWNRIIAKSHLSFNAGNRGIKNGDNVSDLHISPSGNIGVGITKPIEKLTVNGNIRLENGGKLIGTKELEISSDSLIFKMNGLRGLQMKLGKNNDFMLHFPNSTPGSVDYRANRITTAVNGSLAFATNGRGINDDTTDLYIHKTGYIRIGQGTALPAERLTLTSGNIRLENGGKLIGTKELEVSSDSLMFKMNGLRGLQMKKGANGDFTLYFPNSDTQGTKWNRIIAKNHLSFNAGNRGIKNGDNVSDLHISPSGNVGVGIVKPNEKLTVNGSTKIAGKLFVDMDRSEVDEELLEYFSIFARDGILTEDIAIAPIDEWADHVFSSDHQLQSLSEVENYINANKHLPDIPSAAEVKKNGYSLHDMNVKLLQKVEELTLYSIEQNKEIEQLKKVVNVYETLLEKVAQLESKINQ
jgi:hypothetical protein